ncbi:hypothetical protein VF21_10101 [Pseudogymnoascus sp. 05NY08]|nr:hypothetical protein VF21_10101 [Pseudogymnoascus sp. 05NY08]
MIDMGEWGCVEGRGKKAKKPENGTRLQKWLMVFNMLQCTFCREFHARSVDEVESHWHKAGHGKAEGAMIKAVRMQSWGGWNGWGIVKDKDFWVVEEDLQRGSKDGQMGVEVKEDCKDGKNWGSEERVEGEGKQEEEVEWEIIQEENVDVHWDYHGHGVTEGDNAEEVQVQTWYGRFADGYRNLYWVVDESIRWNGEDLSRGLKLKSGLGRDEGERLMVEERKYGENEEMEEAPVEDAPAIMEEETDLKEIPYDNSEESEDWSEEDGQKEREGCKEKENFKGWEGDCFGWRWRETADAGWDEMAEDWVVMH